MDEAIPQENITPPVETLEPLKPKKSKKLIITTILCAILAVAGVSLGVYGIMQANNKSDEIEKLKSQIDNSVSESIVVEDTETGLAINNEIAQNLINPYIKSYFFLNNIFDHEFSEEAKVEIAYLNVPSSHITSSPNSDSKQIDYYSLNEMYQKLFGHSTELTKKDYKTDYTASFTYDGSIDYFTVNEYGSGGTAMAIFSVVKNVYYNDGDITVEVYHDQIPLCDANSNDGYCYNSDNYPITSDNVIFQKFADQIPVYKMIFTKDIDHYVLKDVQK